MINNYNKFNESKLMKEYPYDKVYFKVNSMDDVYKIFDYLDKILGFNVIRFETIIHNFPNYVGVQTNINELKFFKIKYYSDYVTSDRFKEFLKRYENYDPVILKMKDLNLLKSIIFRGNKIPYVEYNEPKKLVYEGIKHLLVGPSKEEVWESILKMKPQDMLIGSIKNGILEGVILAIDRGANIHYDSGYLLRLSASSGNMEIFKFLINKGLGDYIKEYNYIILTSGVEGGNLDIVKYLMNNSTKEGINKYFRRMLNLSKSNNFEDIEDYLYFQLKMNGYQNNEN